MDLSTRKNSGLTSQRTADTGSVGVWLVMRLGWSLLLLPHAVWLARSLTSGDGWFGQQVMLAGSVALFALKVLDVQWLRVSISRRGLVACVLMVGLLHAGVIERSVVDDGGGVLWAMPLVLLTPACMRLGRLGFIRRLSRFVEAFGQGVPPLYQSLWHHHVSVVVPVQQASLGRDIPPRAPPV
jgi:hypothetical protein